LVSVAGPWTPLLEMEARRAPRRPPARRAMGEWAWRCCVSVEGRDALYVRAHAMLLYAYAVYGSAAHAWR